MAEPVTITNVDNNERAIFLARLLKREYPNWNIKKSKQIDGNYKITATP